jgi:hypothetical protein
LSGSRPYSWLGYCARVLLLGTALGVLMFAIYLGVAVVRA